MKIYCKECKEETEHIDQGGDVPKNRRYYCSQCRTSNTKYIFVWPGIIKVYQNNELVYEGTDWKAAQFSLVPF